MKLKRLFNTLFNKKEKTNEPGPATKPISFKAGFDLTQLPIVSLYQGKFVFNFLLDTGSNDSIIDSNILDMIEHTPIDETSSLYGLEGKEQVVEKCNITVTYNGIDFPYTYLVCDMKGPFSKIKAESGVTLHGIIGSKFFNEYKYVLDFESLIAYSKK